MSADPTIKVCTVCHSYATEDLAVAWCPVCGNSDAAGWARRRRCGSCRREYGGAACPACRVRPAPRPARKPVPRPPVPTPADAKPGVGCVVLAAIFGAVIGIVLALTQ